MSADARRELRVSQAEPVLALINTRLAELERRALPKSALAKAVWYARNQWRALCRYTEDGRLSIDNNVSERTLRHQAIGRKNWLFLGSQQAGPRAAILFTILAGASAIVLNRGPICVNCCSACTTTIHVSMRCSPTNGQSNIPKPYSTTDSKNLVAKRQLGVVAAVTREQAAGPADRRPHTMPRPDAYQKPSLMT